MYEGSPIRPNQRGMQVQKTRVDFLPPRWVCGYCAHFAKAGMKPGPHYFAGVMHMAGSAPATATRVGD